MPPIVAPTAAPMTVPFPLEDVDPAMAEDVADGGDAGDGRVEAAPIEVKVVNWLNCEERLEATDSADKYELTSALAVASMQMFRILLMAECTNID